MKHVISIRPLGSKAPPESKEYIKAKYEAYTQVYNYLVNDLKILPVQELTISKGFACNLNEKQVELVRNHPCVSIVMPFAATALA